MIRDDMYHDVKIKITRLLRWTQLFTKIDMVYLAKGSFWMISKQFFLSIVAFGMAIAFAKLIPKETYGFYKYAISIATMLAITTMSGINTALVRSVARGHEGSVISALYERIKWGLVGSGIAFGLVAYYGWQSNVMLAIIFVIIAVFLPFKSSFSVYQAYWQGKQRFDIFAKFTVFQEVLANVPMLITLFLNKNVLVIILVYFFSQTLASAFFFILTILQRKNHSHDMDMIPYGKHISLSGALFFIANNMTDLVIWHMLGPVSVAIFAFATRPPNELRRLFTEAFPIALPKFSQSSKEVIQQTLLKKIGNMYLLLIPCMSFYLFIAPWIFRVFFPEYQEAIYYSQLYSLSILFAPLSLMGTIFQGLGRTKEIYISSMLAPLLLIIALLILTPLYGLTGVVLAILCELFLQFTISLVLFKKM